MTKATIPIGIQPGTKLLRIERVPECENGDWQILSDYVPGYWIVWIHHNPDFTLGTYLTLYHDGRIINSTINEDGTETVFQVKGTDDV